MHVIGTAGHVDHGKSTLVEKLTGIDPDRFAEEKRRGLTIDLGFAWFTAPSGREVGIIDVPGHERFIKNMLAGAGGISVCLFVVAANEGWMPQSAEHLAVLDVLGIEHGVVAVTKADAVDHVTLDVAVEEVRERLAGTTLRSAEIVPCSAQDGTGIDEVVDALDRVLAAAPPSPDKGRPRLWIDRAFTITGAGTVVTGTLTGGRLTAGDVVALTPHGRTARIRAIQTHKKDVEHVGPGQRVALNLAGVDRSDAERGRAIVLPGAWRATAAVDAVVRVLPETLTGRRYELGEKGAHLLYCGTAETPVRISLLEDALAPGEEGVARLWLRDALPLARGDRFVLRDAGRVLTFGGGRVLDPLPRRRRLRRQEHAALVRRLVDADPAGALDALLEAEGAIETSQALLRADLSGVPAGVAVLGDHLVSKSHVLDLTARLNERLQRWHREHPLDAGMPRATLRIELGLDNASFDDLVRRVDEVVPQADVVRAASFGVRLDPEQESRRRRVIETLDEGGFSPPPPGELGADSSLLRALVEAGDLVAIGDFYLTRRRAEEAQERVRAAIAASGPLTVAQIRDLLGTTRKYAVPLCEWLDATDTTRRRGDVRVLGTAAS